MDLNPLQAHQSLRGQPQAAEPEAHLTEPAKHRARNGRTEAEKESPVLMTFAEAAGYLRISTRTLLRYIRDRKIEAYSVAGTRTRRIRRCDVVRLLVPLTGPESQEIEDFIKSRTRVA